MPKCEIEVEAWVKRNALLTRCGSRRFDGVGGLLVVDTDLSYAVLGLVSFPVLHRLSSRVRCYAESWGCEMPHVGSGPEDSGWQRLATVITKRKRKQDWPG